MKYGIFGGTFDPPHIGHMGIARAALDQLGLDEVIWIPANKNPMKTRKSSSAKDRLVMCRLATESEPGMAVSDIDVSRGGPSYLIDTLKELHRVLPGEYWFILGADALETFPTWKNPEDVLRLCKLAFVSRPGIDDHTVLSRVGTSVRERIDTIQAPHCTVSSSFIRDCIRRRERYDDLVTPSVYEYINQHRLYEERTNS